MRASSKFRHSKICAYPRTNTHSSSIRCAICPHLVIWYNMKITFTSTKTNARVLQIPSFKDLHIPTNKHTLVVIEGRFALVWPTEICACFLTWEQRVVLWDNFCLVSRSLVVPGAMVGLIGVGKNKHACQQKCEKIKKMVLSDLLVRLDRSTSKIIQKKNITWWVFGKQSQAKHSKHLTKM